MWNEPADWHAAAAAHAQERVANPFLEQRWQASAPPIASTNPAWAWTQSAQLAPALQRQYVPLDRPMPFMRFSQQTQPALRSSQTATLDAPLRDPSKYGY